MEIVNIELFLPQLTQVGVVDELVAVVEEGERLPVAVHVHLDVVDSAEEGVCHPPLEHQVEHQHQLHHHVDGGVESAGAAGEVLELTKIRRVTKIQKYQILLKHEHEGWM